LRARELALVAAGGMVGTLARYGIGEAAPVEAGRFPLTTFAINVAGAFALGVVLEWLTRHRDLEHWARFVVGVGVLGAFTTFSTFMVELVELVRDGHAATAVAYAVASLVAGAVAVVAGLLAAGWRRGAAVPAEGES
jgi:CrcB protein